MSRYLVDAAKKGDLQKLEALLEQGADINWMGKWRETTALKAAIAAGQREAVRFLLKRGAAINLENPYLRYRAPSTVDGAGGPGDIVQDLIDAGADINSALHDLKRTALMQAAQAGDAPTVSRLLEAGANPHLLDFEQYNAWFLARRADQREVLDILEKAGSGPPPPAQFPPTIPWPKLGPNAPPTSDPAAIVHAYIKSERARRCRQYVNQPRRER